MRLRKMLKICLVFSESEPQYAYKRYAYKKTTTCNWNGYTDRSLVLLSSNICNYVISSKCYVKPCCMVSFENLVCMYSLKI